MPLQKKHDLKGRYREPLRSEAAVQCRALLSQASTISGFVASVSDYANYKRVWARDSMICSLAAMLSGEKSLFPAVRASLISLAAFQGPDGQIPSNVEFDEDGRMKKVSFGTLSGRVDTVMWFIIGLCGYTQAAGDAKLFGQLEPVAARGLQLLSAWEFNRRGLIYLPQGGDWADEYIYHGYILLAQLLRLWALQSLATQQLNKDLAADAAKLRSLLEINYWPEEKNINDSRIYHHQAFAAFLVQHRDAKFFQAALSPGGYSRQFDFFGNSVAILLRLGTEQQRQSVADYGQQIISETAVKLTPAFWPPFFEQDPEWSLIKGAHLEDFRNKPYEYHNGGCWPMICGWWGAALCALGRKNEAADLLNQLDRFNYYSNSNNEHWGFFECANSKSGEPCGVSPQSWSASGALMLEGSLAGKELFGLKM